MVAIRSAARGDGDFLGFSFRHYLYRIPCYSVAEQDCIAAILSTIDKAIAQTEAIIAKQQRIKTALMQDLLTRGIDEHGNIRSEETHVFKDSPLGRIPVEWEVSPIEEKLAQIIDYRGRTPNKIEGGVPLLTAKNVRDGYVEEEPREFIPEFAYQKWMTRGIPEAGDVLFTTEAPMGNVARVPEWKIALAQRLLTLCPKKHDLSQDYLFWLLHWRRTTERLEILTSGSTVIGVKQSVFRKVIFSFPKKDEQDRITRIFDSHKNLVAHEKAQLAKLRRQKTALMQDLLTGKVRVTPLLEAQHTAD
ncbi:MAG: restriction endonuclease subunit S [Verrucomicrobiae bacterium]|nr:restriction endonuclease subunit S [Verrucomicrobiae bacterium]